MTWFNKLKFSLGKTSSVISVGITKIFTHKKLSEDDISEFEDLLISCDIGVNTTQNIIDELQKRKFNKIISAVEAKEFLASYIEKIVEPINQPLFAELGWNLFNISKKNELESSYKEKSLQSSQKQPHVLMMCGVNGNGKTTTSGKIAYLMQKQGYKVIIAACDTFRAAAVEQLEIWANRSNCQLIKGDEGADAGSVAYNAMQHAITNKADLLILDTAGRLHNKINLMEELKKIKKVVNSVLPSAPNDIILVIDGTTGQNSYKQVEVFSQSIGVNGLIITKLDSSAKGGFLIGMAEKYRIPIRAIGIGESIEDLNVMNAKAFAEGLVGL